MTREEAQTEIARVLHAFDHPEYDTCTYCVFCYSIAGNVLNELPE